VAAGVNQKSGGTAMASYADKVVSSLKGISKGVQAKAVKKVGVEV
jgi:hypothetical protein